MNCYNGKTKFSEIIELLRRFNLAAYWCFFFRCFCSGTLWAPVHLVWMQIIIIISLLLGILWLHFVALPIKTRRENPWATQGEGIKERAASAAEHSPRLSLNPPHKNSSLSSHLIILCECMHPPYVYECVI